MYSVHETDGYQVVCAEVQSGDIAGRTIEISYSTTSGTALGTLLKYIVKPARELFCKP